MDIPQLQLGDPPPVGREHAVEGIRPRPIHNRGVTDVHAIEQHHGIP